MQISHGYRYRLHIILVEDGGSYKQPLSLQQTGQFLKVNRFAAHLRVGPNRHKDTGARRLVFAKHLWVVDTVTLNIYKTQ